MGPQKRTLIFVNDGYTKRRIFDKKKKERIEEERVEIKIKIVGGYR